MTAPPALARSAAPAFSVLRTPQSLVTSLDGFRIRAVGKKLGLTLLPEDLRQA
jgi:hypothetical protein